MDMYCVIGKKLAHTLSPEIHRALGEESYFVEEIEDEAALANFVAKRKYAGYNVTIPYKQAIIPLLDRLTPVAREVGAVNTVIDIGGELVGDNTDVGGMLCALRSLGIELAGKEVAILGSGGASKTAQYLCKRDGAAKIEVASRSGELNYQNCYSLIDPQVIVNATPVGMAPNCYGSPIDVKKFRSVEAVFDCVYNPFETLLVQEAMERGINAGNGLLMLVEQAALSRRAFLAAKGKTIDMPNSDMVCKTLTKRLKNIVLVGMAGCGKSTVGAALAKTIGREFVDVDELVESKVGKDIPSIFQSEGEASFRSYERSAVKESCSTFGKVIAVGGGAVLDEENRFYMRANGVVIFLTRDVEKLCFEGRPLSPNVEAAKAIYADRSPIYKKIADFEVANDGLVEETVAMIVDKLEEL